MSTAPRLSSVYLVGTIGAITAAVLSGPVALATVEVDAFVWFLRAFLLATGLGFASALSIAGLAEVGARGTTIAAVCVAAMAPLWAIELWLFARREVAAGDAVREWTSVGYALLGLVAAIAVAGTVWRSRLRWIAVLVIALAPLANLPEVVFSWLEDELGLWTVGIALTVVGVVALVLWLVLVTAAPRAAASVDRAARMRSGARALWGVAASLLVATSTLAMAFLDGRHPAFRAWVHVMPAVVFVATFATCFVLARAAARPSATTPHRRLALGATALGAGIGVELAHGVSAHAIAIRDDAMVLPELIGVGSWMAHSLLAAGVALIASACAALGAPRRVATGVALFAAAAIATSAVLREIVFGAIAGGERGWGPAASLAASGAAQALAVAALGVVALRTSRDMRRVAAVAAFD